ncbi:MAG: hypothetical protein PVI01_14370 [Gemmatimonadales bacterium]|jgi:hypothetical protein
MFKRIASLALAALIVGTTTSCILDPDKKPPVVDKPTLDYKPLTEEWHVLHNMELAYDNRDINRYAELFDGDNFVFFFNPDDVGVDGIPSQWNYDAEIGSARNMFNRIPGTQNLSITGIDLILADNKIEETFWEDTTLPDEFPGETLRQATVTYNFSIDTNSEKTYIAPQTVVPRAQFILREIDGKFKIVRWFDLLVQ